MLHHKAFNHHIIELIFLPSINVNQYTLEYFVAID